ncbi:MAG: EI24 domain-containing protein [Methylocystis sp.]
MLFVVEAGFLAIREIVSPPFRHVLFKSLAMTLAILAMIWIGLDKLALSFILIDHPLLQTLVGYATGAGLFIFLAFFIGPISVIVSGVFLDNLADIVERDLYDENERGQAIAVSQAIIMGLRFAIISAGINFLALLLLFIPGLNAVAFVLANAYLLGREYFLFIATRFLPLAQALEMRRAYAVKLFIAGLFIAVFVAIPGLNVLTPLFGVAFMSRIYQELARQSALTNHQN